MADAYEHKQSIIVDNRNRVRSDETATRFTVTVNSAHVGQQLRGVYVKKVGFVNFFYSVPAGYNTLFWVNDSGTGNPVSAAVPPGSYTPAQLFTAIQAAMEAADSGESVTYTLDATTNRIIVSEGTTPGASGAAVQFFGTDVLAQAGTATSLNELLGVGPATLAFGTDDVNVANRTFPGVLDLTGPHLALLVNDRLAPGSAAMALAGARELSLLSAIPIPAAFGGPVLYEIPDMKTAMVPVSTSMHDLRMLSFELVDIRGAPLVLPVNARFQFELVCVYH